MPTKTTLLFFLTLFISSLALAQCPNLTAEPTDATCFENTDGTLNIFATGGTPPYEYSADGGFTYQTEGFFFDLFPTCDSAFVRDANGCTIGTEYCIFEPPPMSVSTFGDFLSCAGSCDAVVQAAVAGGTGAFTYLWSNGVTGNSGTNFCEGLYTLTVTDANGCFATSSVEIVAPSLIDITFSVTDETCDSGDGSISSFVNGGTAPYVYEWANGATTPMITNLPAGTYSLTIIDANGCASTNFATIESNIKVDISTTDASCDQADGTATATVISGATNPAFLWSNASTNATITGLAQGWYSLSITDLDNGCNTHQNIYIDEDASCKVRLEGFAINDDVNKDCTTDPTSFPMVNRQIRLYTGGTFVATTYTDSLGFYDFVVDNGAYELEFPLFTFDSLLCPTTNTVIINAPTNGQTYNQDFYFAFKEIPDLSIYLSGGVARPGFTQYQSIYYCNNGGAPVDGNISYTHDSTLISFNAGGTEDSYDPLSYTAIWSFTNLQPGECRNFSFSFVVPASTPLGTLLENTASIDPSDNDITPYNNNSTSIQIVTGSYDPNDKQNFSGRDPFGGDIHPDVEEYFYQIRFQNTGTDTAFTVVVKDLIEDNLDITTLRPIAASHDYSMDVEDGNTVVFFFENIMLPDSNVNEPLSHGFVNFVINRKPNLPLGTEISNVAAIYFDFNAPIITNEVVNVLAIPNAIRGQEATTFDFSIFPNPAGETAYLNLALEQAEILDIQVLDVQGRVHTTLLKGQAFQAGKQVLPLAIDGLANGIYFVRVKSAAGSVVRRFAKLK